MGRTSRRCHACGCEQASVLPAHRLCVQQGRTRHAALPFCRTPAALPDPAEHASTRRRCHRRSAAPPMTAQLAASARKALRSPRRNCQGAPPRREARRRRPRHSPLPAPGTPAAARPPRARWPGPPAARCPAGTPAGPRAPAPRRDGCRGSRRAALPHGHVMQAGSTAVWPCDLSAAGVHASKPCAQVSAGPGAISARVRNA